MKRILFRLAAVFLSLIFALALAELTIRIVRPDLADLTKDMFERNSYRIFTNPKGKQHWKHNPDTREKELSIFNSLGSRQHREFTRKKPEGVLRIGIFGDSFTANMRMAAPYSFTEPLEHLFRSTGAEVEVLNFGVDGYDTDQIYLLHRDETMDLGLDVVVYLFCSNDLPGILSNELYTINESNQLTYIPARQPSLRTRIFGKLCLTYLLMQATQSDPQKLIAKDYGRDSRADRKAAHDGVERVRAMGSKAFHNSSEGDRALRLFSEILKTWQSEAQKREEDFLMVFLPRPNIFRQQLLAIAQQERIDVLDLLPVIEADTPNLKPLFFENDPHWNPEGNKYAAVHLFKYLTNRLGLENPSDEHIQQTLGEYYTVFGREDLTDTWLGTDTEVSEKQSAELRERFLSLEKDL